MAKLNFKTLWKVYNAKKQMYQFVFCLIRIKNLSQKCFQKKFACFLKTFPFQLKTGLFSGGAKRGGGGEHALIFNGTSTFLHCQRF